MPKKTGGGAPSRYNGSVALTSQDFRIREAEPADFETLWRIDQECFPPGISYSRAELRIYMRRAGSFTLLATSAQSSGFSSEASDKQSSRTTEEGVSGFVVAEAHRRTGHVITIDVVTAARRHGVGSLLLRQAEGRLRAMGSESIELETAVDNLAALRFYKRHGYSVTQTLPHYYSSGVDGLELRKMLAIPVNDAQQK